VSAIRLAGAAAGVLMIASAVIADRLGGGAGFGRTQLLLSGIGVSLMLLAAAGRRALRVYTGGAVILLSTAVLIGILEVAASALTFQPEDAGTSVAAAGSRRTNAEHLPYYASQSWTPEYWAEQRQVDSRQRYTPYTLWRAAPFPGKHIQVDSTGLRRTPGADCRPGSLRVFVFGGSAAWGVGSPDWGTIPALLQKQLSQSTTPVCVRNFAQSAYVSTQEVIELLRAIQHDEIPDLALFYGGFNDVYAASLYHEADAHLGLDRIRERFESRQGSAKIQSFLQFAEGLQLVALGRHIVHSLSPGDEAAKQPAASANPSTDSMTEAVLATYASNYRAATALAREYRFDVAFFWQPILPIGAKPLTKEERSMVDDKAVYLPLARATYPRVAAMARSLPGLYYLGDAFEADSAQVWADFVHVTPEGNRLLVQQMLTAMRVSGQQLHARN
jgi:hypothetical protein